MNRFLCWFPAAISMLGCGSASQPEAEGAGSLELALETNGVKLSSFTYSITGVDYSRTATVSVAKSSRISALVGGLPVGHFEVTLSATDSSDPSMKCVGSGAFEILPRRTSSTSVNLYCRREATTGSVAIDGSVYRCPTIESLSAEPSEAIVGEVISLLAHAEDPDSTFMYYWTTSAGSLAGAETPNPELTCTSVGPVSLELIVVGADGSCSDTAGATVYCTESGPSEATDDPGTPGDDRVGYTICGAETCVPGAICCAGDVGCAASPEACVAAGAPDYLDYRACDGPEDCPAPEQCAVSRHWVSCGSPSFYGILCHRDSDCVSTVESPNPCLPSGYCDGPFE
jgi:hypothetical protein